MPVPFADQKLLLDELVAVVRALERGERAFRPPAAFSTHARDMHLAGLAQSIAQAYTRVEGLLNFVARQVDADPVVGESWHRMLLIRVRQPRTGVRPAVISSESSEELRELLSFRHVVRSHYPTELEEPPVRAHLARLVRATRRFSREYRRFLAQMAPRATVPRKRRRKARVGH